MIMPFDEEYIGLNFFDKFCVIANRFLFTNKVESLKDQESFNFFWNNVEEMIINHFCLDLTGNLDSSI